MRDDLELMPFVVELKKHIKDEESLDTLLETLQECLENLIMNSFDEISRELVGERLKTPDKECDNE